MTRLAAATSNSIQDGAPDAVKDFASCVRASQLVQSSPHRDQDKRDVERDMVRVNGVLCVGANLGFEGVMDVLRQKISEAHHVADETWVGRPRRRTTSEADDARIASFARAILSTGNRTTSGGDAFEAVIRIVGGMDDVCLITPDSKAPIEPVRTTVDTGPYRCAGAGWKWGLRATVTASTFYNVTDAGNIVEGATPLLKIKATYTRSLCLPFAVSPKDGIGPMSDHDAFAPHRHLEE